MRRQAFGPIALIPVLLLPWVLTACGDDLSLEPDRATFDRAPELSVSADQVELEQIEFDQRAVELFWSPGSNRGTSAAIDYTLEFDRSGDFSNGVTVPVGRAVYTYAYSVAAFNEFLLDQLGLEPESPVSVAVRLRAVVAGSGGEAQLSNPVEVGVRPYRRTSPTLYLIGSAAPGGWSADDAAEMRRDPLIPFLFTYEGPLVAGELKFITTLGEFLPSYNRGDDGNRLVYRTDDSKPDDKFVIEEPGSYRVTANLAALTLEIERAAGPAYSELWMVGDAVPTGWDLDNAPGMRQDPADPFLFDFNEILNAGELKIATARDWGAPFYRPTSNHPDLTDAEVQLSAGDPDHKWLIPEAGAYKIALDVRNMTIAIEPFMPYTQLWMVGDATPAGWNIDDPTPLEPVAGDPYTFIYDGPLQAGELKFPVTTGDWGADYFMPGSNYQPLDSDYVRFVPRGDPDHKWRIEEAGSYRITLNQLYETISIERE